jgi:hypothetical protein
MLKLLDIQTTLFFLLIYIVIDSIGTIRRIKDFDKNGILFIYPRDTILIQYRFLKRRTIEYIISFKVFKILVFFRLFFAILILLLKPIPFFILVLFLIQLYLHLRNDSLFCLADRFVLPLILTLSIYYNFENSEKIQNYSILFIGLLVIIAYFFTAFYKLKSELWRKGLAIEQIISTDLYGNEKYYTFLRNHRFISRFLNYSTIIFQLSAPLTIFSSNFAIAFIIIGVFFHLSIAIIMNLNNFFWVFVSTYPCIYFVSLKFENFL